MDPAVKKAKAAAAKKAEAESEKKAAIRKAVSAANSQLFKLFKAARNANGPINVAKALVAVFESLKKKVNAMGPDALVSGSQRGCHITQYVNGWPGAQVRCLGPILEQKSPHYSLSL